MHFCLCPLKLFVVGWHGESMLKRVHRDTLQLFVYRQVKHREVNGRRERESIGEALLYKNLP